MNLEGTNCGHKFHERRNTSPGRQDGVFLKDSLFFVIVCSYPISHQYKFEMHTYLFQRLSGHCLLTILCVMIPGEPERSSHF